MKSKSRQSKFLGLISVLSMLSGLLVACGGGFESGAISSKTRPPITSDPLTAQRQRMWESAQNLDSSMTVPVLETETERESFLQDITEQRRTYTDDELADEAETQFQKNEKERLEKASVEDQDAGNKKQETIPPKDSRKEPVNPAPEKLQEKAPESKKMPSLPKAPKPSVKSDFCEDLNVTSARGEADLSDLYNDKGSLPTAMPVQVLASSPTIAKKNKFICVLLPIAIRMNEEVYRQRLEILRLQAKKKKGAVLTTEEQDWLTKMKVAYSLSTKNSNEELLKRVDIIPLPLMLAQAALESGWGTSRATRDLKNLFGMHAARGQPCQKSQDPRGACIRKFSTLAEGVSAYIRLLNVGSPYEKFREVRHQFRTRKEPLDSLKLLESLGRYNETPQKYIQDVRELMTKHNKLTQFNFKEEEVKR